MLATRNGIFQPHVTVFTKKEGSRTGMEGLGRRDKTIVILNIGVGSIHGLLDVDGENVTVLRQKRGLNLNEAKAIRIRL